MTTTRTLSATSTKAASTTKLGYEAPYRWATEATVPFVPLPGPLKSLRLGLITAADRAPRSEGRDSMLYAQPLASRGAFHTEMFWTGMRPIPMTRRPFCPSRPRTPPSPRACWVA